MAAASPAPTFPPLLRSAGRRLRPQHHRAGMSSSPPALPLRFAVLKTGHASEYTERTYGGYASMLRTLLSDAGDPWDIFSVVDGDFSFLDQRHLYHGYVLTGSSADAHGDADWILRLCDALRILHADRKRLLGICFGHQILARALGGKTGRAEVGWELGLKHLSLDSEALRELYGFDHGSHLYVIESHQDQVLEVPQGARVLASSEKTSIEMFALGDNVLAMQFHPEFTKDVIVDIIQKRRSKQIIGEDVAEEALRSLEDREAEPEPLKQLCKIFLKGSQVNVLELQKEVNGSCSID